MVTRLNGVDQHLPRYCFLLVFVLVCASTPVLRAQTANEKIVFSIPSRSIAAIDLYSEGRSIIRGRG